MARRYYKRYRMECPLPGPMVPPLPPGYVWRGWRDDLLPFHADAKYQSFQEEMDTGLFPSLGEPAGCLSLMKAIRARSGFIPGSTWLIVNADGVCGTVQGLRDGGYGMVQNLGVVPAQRGRGLGEALLLKALDGFARAGLGRGCLEVTVDNHAAVRLYRRLGFRASKTLYKPAPVAAAVAAV